MWYHIRSAYNWLLTGFLGLGVVLMVLGTAVVALLLVGLVISVIQHMLGYDMLLTQDMVYQAGMIFFLTGGLGCLLGLLGLGATHPRSIRRTQDRP